MNHYIDITASKIVNSKGWIPKNIFLTKGTGIHNEKLASFELALRSAGIASYNLISVSSILPPNCDIIDQSDGVKMLQPGQVVPVVLARSESKKPDILVSSGVGIAVPKNRNDYGYLSEHHATGIDENQMEDYVEDLAAEMLATTYGLEFDPDASWDEKRELWNIDDRIVETKSIVEISQTSSEKWTTVVCAAVLII
jgi:arginine decarboxylase|tara:strand:- start:528 stop:1118 length:591 start_codon:yes stop_codon:yes gene_type:complete